MDPRPPDPTSDRLPKPDRPSQRLFGSFELIQELGRGGMGVVWRARDTRDGREVALKVLLQGLDAQGPARLERFRREAIITHALDHPGIVRAVNAGVANGRPWVAFELVEGARTFQEVLREVPARRRAELVRDAARALGFAHARKVVHRDVKPANLLVDSGGRVRVTDFGLAAARGLEPLTQTGSLVGTPLWMSPEQADGRRDEVGPPSDVWGLGVVLYEALTGELPFQGATFLALADAIRKASPKAPRSTAAGAGIDPGLEAVCLRALQRDPARRHADGEALAADLDRALAALPSDLEESDAVTAKPSLPGRPARRALLVTHLTVAAIGLLAIAGGLAWRRARDPAHLHAQAVRLERRGDLVGARAAYERAARGGALDAMVALAAMLEEGRGGPPDRAAAETWWRTAAEADHLPALSGLARHLASDPAQALPWLERAAGLGDPVAMRELGRLLDGRGEAARAAEWYRKAGDAGDAPAMLTLVKLLERKEPRAAMDWLRRAAVTGDPTGMRLLGEKLIAAPALALDAGEAERWLARAARGGDGRAMALLGQWLLRSPDRAAEGRAWLARGAQANDPLCLRVVGVHHLDERRFEAALEPLLRAVTLGDGPAADRLGGMFREGRGVPRDDRLARTWFRVSSELGDPTGTTSLAILMADGVGGPQDASQALALFRRAAEAGSVDAMYRLGRALERGDGGPRDPAQGIVWLKRAADLGNARAIVRLGQLLAADASAGAERHTEAAALFRRAAELGEPAGMNEYAHSLATGSGVPKDEGKAAEWFRRAAEAGQPTAMTNYGLFLREGRGVARDPDSAMMWFRRAAEAGDARGKKLLAELETKPGEPGPDVRVRAERGEADGMAALGAQLRAQGDTTQAERWLRRAVDAGHLAALLELARLLFETTGERAPAAKREAVELLRRAVERGSNVAMNDLGRALVRGEGVAADPAQAVALFRRAAEAGEATAMMNLGLLYRDGVGGLPRDEAQAVAWLRRSADAGQLSASVHLAGHLETGRGVAVDRTEALRRYHAAAEKDDAEGMVGLGRMLLSERPQGAWAEAVKWLQRAAKKGERAALLPLARALSKGRGTRRNMNGAVAYLRGAVSQGDVAAGLYAVRLFDQIGRSEEARRLAQAIATEGKDPRGMVELARLLARGRGGPVDAKGAIEWLQRAVEAESPEGLAALAYGLAAANDGRAADVFRRAADAGHVPSMVEHARRLRGTDAPGARAWLERAFRAGDSEAALLLATEP